MLLSSRSTPTLLTRPLMAPISLMAQMLPMALLLLALFGLGCAESGGGESSGTTGRVAIALTDAPTSEFVQVLVTVVRIDLLPGDDEVGRETIFEGTETFDLLALENVAEPFAIAADVPTGTYNKLRMEVTEIELVRMLTDGTYESVFPRLPGGGRIDLNPRGGFEVTPDSTLAVQLDVDARRSIHIVGSGNGQYHFRPQVFVEIMDADRVSRLVSLEGVVDRVDAGSDPREFELCEIALEYRDRDGRRDRHCVTVFADWDTSVFDAAGLASDRDAIEVGERLAVLGRFTRDEDAEFAVDAVVVELGGSAAFLTLTGVISGEYDEASETLLFDVDPGQGLAPDTSVEIDLSQGTRIFTRDGMELAPAEVELDSVAEVDGVIVLGSGEPDQIRAAILFVRVGPMPGEPPPCECTDEPTE